MSGKKKLLISLACAFIVLFLACSSNKNDKTESQSESLTPISIQLQWVPQSQFAGYYVALDKGWYQKENLEVTIKPGGPDLIPVELVAAGTSDFGTTVLTDLSVAIQKGKQVISIAQIQQDNGLFLIAKKSSGIKTPKDFIGKSVGVWLGSWEAQFNALIAKEKIDINDMNIISQGWSMRPFLNNEMDVASVMIYNEYHIVLEKGIKPEQINLIDYKDYGLGFPGDVLFTNHRMIKDHPDLCVRVLRASLKGWQYALKHPEEAVDIILKYDNSGIQTKQHQLSMIKEISKLVQPGNQPIGYVDPARIQQMLDTLLDYGIINKKISQQKIYTTRFLDQVSTISP